MQVFTIFSHLYQSIIKELNCVGSWLSPFILRLFVAWEFSEAGFEKLNGTNWFADISFPFPFSLLPPEISWSMAIFFEVVGGIAIALGFATRFFATSLFILTIVAIATVHWPSEWNTFGELLTGYRFTDKSGDGLGNYKLPLIYMIALIPLILNGAGKFSLDFLPSKFHQHRQDSSH
jgi:putative oxidoreductase